MNVNMWNQPDVQANVKTMEDVGWRRIGPGVGELACGTEGEGRMAEPDEIVTTIMLTDFSSVTALENRNVLILSGPTREHLDPMRYLSNASSGKMGKALAEEAMALGATVDFVTGPVANANMPRGPRLKVHSITSAQEMLEKAESLFGEADVAVFAAAVADYAPTEAADEKLSKSATEFTMSFKPTPDIAATLCARKKAGQVAVGFALQDRDGKSKALAKMQEKKLNAIVLNSPRALGADKGTYSYLGAGSGEDFVDWGELPKRSCAQRILNEAAKLLER